MNHRYWIQTEGKDKVLNQGQWVEGLWLQGRLWLHVNGETFVVENQNKDFGQGQGTKTKSDIISPMPGKVTKVLAQESASVSVGQVLIVMEAMKMEYSLKAEVAGTVTQVECQVGDQVPLGKRLVKVSAEKAEPTASAKVELQANTKVEPQADKKAEPRANTKAKP